MNCLPAVICDQLLLRPTCTIEDVFTNVVTNCFVAEFKPVPHKVPSFLIAKLKADPTAILDVHDASALIKTGLDLWAVSVT